MLAISFSLNKGTIRLFRSTVKAIGEPEFYRFLLNTGRKKIALQACGMRDDGAKKVPIVKYEDCYEHTSIDLVRFVYKACGWDPYQSYRAYGVLIEKENLVEFDLANAVGLATGSDDDLLGSLDENSQEV